jgi:S1-C subfamily serine protease
VGLIKELKLEEKGSVMVKKILPDFPADKGGLQKGDIIISLNGKSLPLSDPLSFFRQRIMEAEVGSKIKVEVLRLRERTLEPMPGAKIDATREAQLLTITIEVGIKPKTS